MKNSLYNRKHIREYIIYGLLAALAYMIPTWIFFAHMDYEKLWTVFSGSILFMFIIMLYSIRLSRRRPDYKSTWMMIVAAHFAILVGIVLSVLLTLLACFIYIPGFLSGESTNVLENASGSLNANNRILVTLLFTCATVENFGAAGFMAILGPYVFKRNQTKDKFALLEPEIDLNKKRNEPVVIETDK